MTVKTILASEIAVLDSDVRNGGGTDVTKEIQNALDEAKRSGGVRLIMDGAALVSELVVHSNTTIECLTSDCGFFQKGQSNHPLIRNEIWDRKERTARNISLIGGTYNGNCMDQIHDYPEDPWMNGANSFEGRHGTVPIEFCGVEDLLVRGIRIVDFRTYAFMLTNFRNCTIEDSWVDLPHRMHAQNQDGFHFWGPGEFLTLRNVGGKVGDDFMNIGPDEGDGVSSITDVLVDGVFLDDADQAIRILSRGTGLCDRVTIRNVSGSYRSFGFYINSWFPDTTAGNFGDIFIENVSLTHTAPNYDYRPPMLFSVGGDIRCLTLKNIRHEYPIDSRAVGEFGFPFHSTTPDTIDAYVAAGGKTHKIQNLIIDGVTVLENGASENMEVFSVYGEIGNLVLKNVFSAKDAGVPRSGKLLAIHPTGSVDLLIVKDVVTVGSTRAVTGKERVGTLIEDGITER